jgi:hypothetical protein
VGWGQIHACFSLKIDGYPEYVLSRLKEVGRIQVGWDATVARILVARVTGTVGKVVGSIGSQLFEFCCRKWVVGAVLLAGDRIDDGGVTIVEQVGDFQVGGEFDTGNFEPFFEVQVHVEPGGAGFAEAQLGILDLLVQGAPVLFARDGVAGEANEFLWGVTNAGAPDS